MHGWNELWNKENGMYEQCHEPGLDKISRRCFLSAAASAAGFALAGPALAERIVRPGEKLDSANAQSQNSTDPSPLTVSCPDCCMVLSDYRDHA
jgi:hypothetical protein